MKTGILITTLILLTATIWAQEIPQPEFNDIPYILNKSNNTLLKPSKESASIKGGLKGAYSLKGTTSATNVATSEVSFVLKTDESMVASALKIYQLTVKKKTRSVVFVTAGLGSANLTNEGEVSFNVKKLDGNVYQFVLDGPLEVGEYAIQCGMYFYTFTIEK